MNNDVLSNHLKSHNIYACDKCHYKSNSLQGLNGHSKIHIQKLKCSKCEFSCTTLNKLNNHVKIHTGDEISNAPKRSLSVSPEIVQSNTKNVKSLNNSKKSKN